MATVPQQTKQPEPQDEAPKRDPDALPGEYSLEGLRKDRLTAETGRLRTTFNTAREIPPDRAKRVLTLLGKTGIDADLLDQNLEQAEFEASKPNFNPEEFRLRSPIMSKWLEQSPHHMRLVHDDLVAGKLNNLEKVFARLDNPNRVLSGVERAAMAERRARSAAKDRRMGRSASGVPYFMGGQTDDPDPEDLKRYRAEIDENEEFIEGSGTVSGFDAGFWKRKFQKNPVFLLPFLETFGEAPEHIRLFEAVKALREGNETDDDRDFLITFGRLADAADRRGTDVWAKTADVVAGSIPFAAEFALTGGAYSGAKVAAMKFIKEGVRAALHKSMRSAVRQGVGAMVGTLARTTVGGLPRLVDGSIQRMTQGIDIKPNEQGQLQAVLSDRKPDDFVEAVTKEFGTLYIENLSETTGVALSKTVGWMKARLFKGWMDTHPQGSVAQFIKLAESKAGWHGVLGEMFEERVGEVMRAGVGLEEYKLPTAEQLGVEFMAFLIPGLPGNVLALREAHKAHGRAVAAQEDEKAIASVLASLGITQTAPELAGPMIEDISKAATQGTDSEFKYIDPVKVEKYYTQKGVDPKVKMAELGVQEQYEQGLANHHDVQVPTAKFDAYLSNSEDAEFWRQEAVKAPGLETVPETEQRIKRLEEHEKARAEAAKAIQPTPEQEAEKQAQVEQKRKFDEGAKRVREVVANALKEAKRPAKEIRVGSAVAERMWRVIGERMGADPFELFKEHHLSVQAGEEATAAPAAQGETGDAPVVAGNENVIHYGAGAAKGKRTLHQGEKARSPIFHSRLRRLVDQKMPARASAEQLAGIVKDIKGEELQWLGMNEFLATHKGDKSISKEQVLAWLELHDLRIAEVMRGEKLTELPPGYTIEDRGEFTLEGNPRGDRRFLVVRPDPNDGYEASGPTMEEAIQTAIRRINDEGRYSLQFGPRTHPDMQLPGGKEHRELLLTLPVKRIWVNGEPITEADLSTEQGRAAADRVGADAESVFRGSHFEEGNILAHVRFNERVDAEGKRVLFIEEIQSDWHQEGRRKGYAAPRWEVKDAKGLTLGIMTSEQAATELAAQTEGATVQRGRDAGVPNAPFKKTWHEFAFKRMIRYAAENGFDKIAWTTGDQQNERYDLSKQIEALAWRTTDGGKTFDLNAEHDHQPVLDEFGLTQAEVATYVGEELAQKIAEGAGRVKYPGDTDLEYSGVLTGLDLKVGGEGMRGFYDKILPSFASKFGKKYGAVVEPLNLNLPPVPRYTIEEDTDGRRDIIFNVVDRHGDTVESFSDREDAEDALAELNTEDQPLDQNVHSMEITPALKEAALVEGFSLFQPGGKKNRGRITIGKASIDIALLKDADFSTFLHEFAGHFYLEVLKDLASRQDAPREVREDWQTVLDWLGVKDASEITDDHHEKFADGVERYFWEGKAPSTALRRVFWHCKVMLTRIYKAFVPGEDLNDQMRRVFDRMLATEEEIADAAAEYGNPLYTVLLNAGMDPDRAAKLAKATLDAQIARDDRLRVRALKDLHREERADWKAQRERIRAEVAAETYQRQDVQLMANLLTGLKPDGSPLDPGVLPVKLWDKALKEGDYVQADALPAGVVGKRSEGAEHPDAVAYTYGFQNAGEMINALVQVGDINDFIERQTDDRMIERFGPRMTEEEIRQAAEESVHSEERETQLRLELEELVAKDLAAYKAGVRTFAGKPRIPDAAVIHREAAKDVGKFSVRQIRPAMFKAAEIRAARATLEAALKGDWATAADQQLIQYLNFARYQAAVEARTFMAKSLELVREISKGDKKVSKTRNMDLVNAARSILSNYEIGNFDKGVSIYMEQLKNYEPAMYEALAPYMNAALVGARDYRDVPFSQFQSMMETVQGFWDLSAESKKMEVAGEKVEIEMVAGELTEDTKAMGQPHAKAGYRRNNTTWEDTQLWLLSARARLRRIESWADAMGPKFTKYIWRPIVEGTDTYRAKRVAAIKKLYVAAKAMGQLKRGKIEAPEIGYTFDSEGEMIMALLHSGNESNLRKLLLGREWGGQDENKNLDISTWERFRNRAMQKGIIRKEHYDFVQAVWDIMEDLKPAAQLAHKGMFGRFFAEISADQVTTIWGVYRGGYFPAKTDPRFVSKQAVNLEKDDSESFNNSYAWPTTGRGATIERVHGYTKQLSLNFNLIPQHIDWALRFSYIEPRVREMNRLLNNKEFAGALEGFDPKAMNEMLVPWLQRAASQRVEDGPKGPLDNWWRFVRRSAGVQVMALNVPNALQNLTGLVVAGVKVKPKHIRNALFTYMGDQAKFAEAIRAKSSMMSERTDSQAMQMMADVREIVLDPSTFSKLQTAAQRHAYALQRLTQNAVDNVVWGAAYEQAVEDGVAEPEAVQHANAAVRLTQSSNNAEDVARYEVGSPFYRLFVQFTSYFNMKANLMATEFAKEIRTSGLKNGAGRMLYLYAMGHAIPAMLAAAIFKVMSGGWDDDDDDGYLDELMATMFGSQVKELLAMVPGIGQGVNALVGGFTPATYDDRVNLSPAIQAIERGLHAPGEVYNAVLDGKGVKKATKDALSVLGLFSGIPTSPIVRPVGYLMDVETGTAEPSGPVDYARGLVTGKPGPKR